MTREDQAIHASQNWAAWNQDTKTPAKVHERTEFAAMITHTRLIGVLTPAERIRAIN